MFPPALRALPLCRAGSARVIRPPRFPAALVARFSASATTDLSSPSHPSGLNFWGTGKGLGLSLPPNRAPLYQEAPHNDFVLRYYWLVKAMGMFTLKARIGVNSEAIFRSIEEQALQNCWFEALRLERNWLSEHSLIALHVWLFHNRFKVDYNVAGDFNGRRMQEQLFERFWENTSVRIRNAGIAESEPRRRSGKFRQGNLHHHIRTLAVSVNKQLENVQKISFDDMFSYDAAIKVVDDDNMELAGALWKGVFREAESADTEAVLRLADYVRREVVNVVLHPREDLYRGWVAWGPCVGETREDRLGRQRRMLEGEWRDALHVDGRVFFYHTTTHERRWDPPPAGLTPRRTVALTRLLEDLRGEGAGGAALPASSGASDAQQKLGAGTKPSGE